MVGFIDSRPDRIRGPHAYIYIRYRHELRPDHSGHHGQGGLFDHHGIVLVVLMAGLIIMFNVERVVFPRHDPCSGSSGSSSSNFDIIAIYWRIK